MKFKEIIFFDRLAYKFPLFKILENEENILNITSIDPNYNFIIEKGNQKILKTLTFYDVLFSLDIHVINKLLPTVLIEDGLSYELQDYLSLYDYEIKLKERVHNNRVK